MLFISVVDSLVESRSNQSLPLALQLTLTFQHWHENTSPYNILHVEELFAKSKQNFGRGPNIMVSVVQQCNENN